MLGGFKSWFAALSLAGKIAAVTAGSVVAVAAASSAGGGNPPPVPVVQEPKPNPTTAVKAAVVKTETTTEAIPFETQTIDDSSLTSGTDQVRTEGVNGVKTKTWNVTYTDGKETGRTLAKEETTTSPVTKVIAHGTKPNCDPNYTPCIPYVSYDLDCADIGFTVRVIGADRHRLDRDHDGYGCE